MQGYCVYKYYLRWGELFITGEFFLQNGRHQDSASILRFFSLELQSHGCLNLLKMAEGSPNGSKTL